MKMILKMIKLSNELCSIPWYLMPVSEQKTFCVMVMRSQKPAGIQLPLIGPLNMETLTVV